MSDNQFFKPTVLYKEYMILDMIEKNPNITQREMSKKIGIAVSMINNHIDGYENKGLIKRKKHSTKTVEYFVTKKGSERRKLLNIWYLKSSNNIYIQAKDNIISFLNQIIDKGFKKIILYGAGEVAEIMLQVMNDDNQIPLEVVAVIDDNKDRVGDKLVNIPIITLNELSKYNHDGIMISSFKHHQTIHNNLVTIDYPKSKIIHFFDN
ncbi:MAG: winged helix-turn-helix transcriptional regulator [Acholeplasma sp.]|nr:winged helix-turn-helix transcriptional regulator [Acholeplasma sp.]